jgi:hypothetical protein
LNRKSAKTTWIAAFAYIGYGQIKQIIKTIRNKKSKLIEGVRE